MSRYRERLVAAGVIGLLLAAAVYLAAVPVSNVDTWWHLRLGNDLLDQGPWSTPDWSNFGTRPWTLSEPLPEMALAWAERHGGLPAVAWWFGVALMALVVLVFLTLRRLAAPQPAAITTFLTIAGASASLAIRPQLVTFALVSVLLLAWWKTDQDGRPRWWLVPTLWLWAWCHGFWIIGAALSGVCWLGLVLDRRLQGRAAARGAVVVVAGLAVGMATSAGWHIYLAPFEVHDTSVYILEWTRPKLYDPRALVVTVMLAVAGVIWYRHAGRRSFLRLFLLLVALGFTWLTLRTIAVGAFIAAPLLAEALQLLRERSEPDASASTDRVGRREAAALVGAAAVALAVLALLVPITSEEPGEVPTGLDPALDRLPAGAVLFNDYNLGGWISWRHPDLQRVVDGLVVPYPPDFVDDYLNALRAEPGWQDFVASTHPDAALLAEHGALAAQLRKAGWRNAGTDDDVVLLLPPGSQTG